MEHAHVIILQGNEDEKGDVLGFCGTCNLALDRSRVIFVGSEAAAVTPPSAGDARLALVWEELPLPEDVLAPWLAASDGQRGSAVFVLFHGPPYAAPPEGPQRALEDIARDRPVVWIPYSRDGIHPAYVAAVAVLKSVGNATDYFTAHARLIRTLAVPLIERTVDRILVAFLTWDLELQLQIERRDTREADAAHTKCELMLEELDEDLTLLSSKVDGSNPVVALECFSRNLGAGSVGTTERMCGGRVFKEEPSAQFAALRACFKCFNADAIEEMDEAQLRGESEEFHQRLRDLRDLLLGLVGVLDAEEP